jgi:Fe-S cluster assembly protein SufD
MNLQAITALAQGYAQSLNGSGGGPMGALRRDGLARLQRVGLPGPHLEAWKHTRVDFSTRGVAPVPARAIPMTGWLQEPWVVVDGRLAGRGGEPLGEEGDDPMRALNAAFATDNVSVHVADDRTLEIVHVSSGDSAHMSHPRLNVRVAAGCTLSLCERFVSAHDDSFCNAAASVVLEQGARVVWLRVQEDARHVSDSFLDLGAGAQARVHTVSLGGEVARTAWRARLGERATLSLSGLYVGQGRDVADVFTEVQHTAPHATSAQRFRGLFGGRSTGVFSGKVVVLAAAQKTDARQESRSLLLGPHASANTRPQLQIYADDVRCTHGATIGQLDENQVFYLRSRGIDEVDARRELTLAFAREALADNPFAMLQTRLEAAVQQRLAT